MNKNEDQDQHTMKAYDLVDDFQQKLFQSIVFSKEEITLNQQQSEKFLWYSDFDSKPIEEWWS